MVAGYKSGKVAPTEAESLRAAGVSESAITKMQAAKAAPAAVPVTTQPVAPMSSAPSVATPSIVKPTLTTPESQEFFKMIQRGIPGPDAIKNLMAQRQLNQVGR